MFIDETLKCLVILGNFPKFHISPQCLTETLWISVISTQNLITLLGNAYAFYDKTPKSPAILGKFSRCNVVTQYFYTIFGRYHGKIWRSNNQSTKAFAHAFHLFMSISHSKRIANASKLKLVTRTNLSP